MPKENKKEEFFFTSSLTWAPSSISRTIFMYKKIRFRHENVIKVLFFLTREEGFFLYCLLLLLCSVKRCGKGFFFRVQPQKFEAGLAKTPHHWRGQRERERQTNTFALEKKQTHFCQKSQFFFEMLRQKIVSYSEIDVLRVNRLIRNFNWAFLVQHSVQ